MSLFARTLKRMGPAGVLFVLALVVLVFMPFVTLLLGSFKSTPFGAWTFTLDGFSNVFGSLKTYEALGISIFYSVAVLVLAILFGLGFAFATARSRAPLVRLLLPAMVVVAAIPRLFFGLSWGMIGNPRTGLIASWLREVGVMMPDWMTAYSIGGLVFVTTLKVTAVAYLLLLGPVMQLDRGLEDAAVMSGVSRARAVRLISIPMLTPALLAIAMLMFVEGIQVYDFPALLISPAGYETLSTSVDAYLNKEITPQWSSASALSLIVMVVIAGLLVVQSRMTRGREFTSIVGKSRQAPSTTKQRGELLVTLAIVLYLALALVLPLAQMVIGSLQPYFGMYGTYTLANYAAILSDGGQVKILLTTLVIASVGGVAVVALAFVMACIMNRSRIGFLTGVVKVASWVPATAPGIVLSLAFVWTFTGMPGLRALYGTNTLLFIALVVAHLPLAVRACEGILAQVSTDLEDAARISAASPATVVMKITARLSAPSLAAAWVLVSLAIAGALDVPLLLQSTSSQTVSTYAFSLYANGEVAQAAAFFLAYLVLFTGLTAVLALFALAQRMIRRQAGIVPAAA